MGDSAAIDTSGYVFSLEMEVRDYELDSEGIVNNATYLHYLEHTRHRFCQWAGMSFADMQSRGIVPVLSRVEIDYKTPLQSGDVMISCLNVAMKGVRFVFEQDIFKKSTGEPVVKAKVSCVALENGRLTRGEALREAFANFL